MSEIKKHRCDGCGCELQQNGNYVNLGLGDFNYQVDLNFRFVEDEVDQETTGQIRQFHKDFCCIDCCVKLLSEKLVDNLVRCIEVAKIKQEEEDL